VTQAAPLAAPANLRVVKLGGSLLDWTDWPRQFREWLRRQPRAATILLVGGGGLADVVRGWDRTYRLDATASHRLAIGTMSLTARLAAGLLPEAMLIDRWESLVEWLAEYREATDVSSESTEGPGPLIVLDPWDFMERVEPTVAGQRLPHGWQVTSDSIAARLAVAVGNAELVLMKSSLPPASIATLEQAVRLGLVDGFMPEAAAELSRVRCVNLRADAWPEWVAPGVVDL
jgi:aspartokinase-like uncharacterized kinase